MDILNVVLGNICSLLAMGTDAISTSRKSINKMLWIQNASQLFYGIGSVILKGYSGAVQNAVCIIRNLVVIKGVKSKVIEWLLVIFGIIFGFYFNNIGFMGVLPIIANLQYTLVIFYFQDNERAMKISFMISALLFIFFSLAIWNFVGVFTNLVVAVSTIVFLVKDKSSKED